MGEKAKARSVGGGCGAVAEPHIYAGGARTVLTNAEDKIKKTGAFSGGFSRLSGGGSVILF